jgi:hypothetical protein
VALTDRRSSRKRSGCAPLPKVVSEMALEDQSPVTSPGEGMIPPSTALCHVSPFQGSSSSWGRVRLFLVVLVLGMAGILFESEPVAKALGPVLRHVWDPAATSAHFPFI